MRPAANIADDELAELRALHLRLPHLRRKPWEEIAANQIILGCLRNALQAARRARAERQFMEPGNFELTP